MAKNSAVREPRSVRLDDDEWLMSEVLSSLLGRGVPSAGEGLRIALDMAVKQVICEGDGEYGSYPCPASGEGNHVFESATGEAPRAGEWTVCMGGDGYLCGYGLLWRGGEALLREQSRLSALRMKEDRDDD